MGWHRLALALIFSAAAYGQQANLDQILQQLTQLQHIIATDVEALNRVLAQRNLDRIRAD